MKTFYQEMVEKAISMLNNDDDLYCDMVDSLDSWDGYADGYRAYEMEELNDLCYGMTASELIHELTGDFNINDNYFYWSIYGLESTDDKAELYRNNTSSGEVFDNILENYSHIYFYNKDFENLIKSIIEYREEIGEE